MNLSILDAALETPDRPALISPSATLTYRELAERVLPVACWLATHGEEGRPVGLVADSTVQALINVHALLAIGSPAVLLHPRWSELEQRRALNSAGCSFLLSTENDRRAAPSLGLRAISDDERALAIVQTSGSTGAPRAVELSRRAFRVAAMASAERLGWREDDRWLLSLPFAHVGGLSVITRCLEARRTVVLQPPSTAASSPMQAWLNTVVQNRVTLASVVPTQLSQLLKIQPRPTAPLSLRALLVGGASTPSSLLAEAADRGWPVLSTYGMTETCSQVATQLPGPMNRGKLGCGPPLPGTDVRIREGVIQVRSPSLFTRHVPSGEPPQLDGEGWFTTGDLGSIDHLGNLHVLGRRDDVIVTGGEKVSPQKVESKLLRQWGVDEACVFGAADSEWGQLVCVALVQKASIQGRPFDPLHVIRGTRADLAPFEVPRRFALVEALPRNANGKVDRRAVAAHCGPLLRPVQGP